MSLEFFNSTNAKEIEIKKIFASINADIVNRRKLSMHNTFLNVQFDQLDLAVLILDSELSSAIKKDKIDYAYNTTHKLKIAYELLYNPHATPELIEKAISDFQNTARDAKCSHATRVAIFGVAAALSAFVVLMIVLPIILPYATVVLSDLFLVSAVQATAIGFRIAASENYYRNPLENRGSNVASSLGNLVKSKNEWLPFFTPKTLTQLIAMEPQESMHAIYCSGK